VKLGTKYAKFYEESLSKLCPKSDMRIDQIRISDIANLKIYYLDSGQCFGHNSLKTGPNDLKFIPLIP